MFIRLDLDCEAFASTLFHIVIDNWLAHICFPTTAVWLPWPGIVSFSKACDAKFFFQRNCHLLPAGIGGIIEAQ